MRSVSVVCIILFCASGVWAGEDDYDPCKSADIIQGDIAVEGLNSPPRRKRAATAFKSRLWRNGVIPFEIEDNVYTGEQRAILMQAIKHWENNTCLTFIEHTNEKDYIFFHKGRCGCCSFVGRKGNGKQGISIGKNCDKFGIVVHEIGHVVGFWHEHTRPDRDRFVTILRENIKKGEEHNFDMLSRAEIDSRNEPYDYGSIMHYGRYTFAKSPSDVTIRPRGNALGGVPEIGQRARLSDGDVRQILKMYQCAECGRSLQEASGSFSSPGYPQTYPTERECEWRIAVSPGQRIVVTFTRFHLNKASSNCRNSDYVEIREGHSRSSPLIGRYCGKNVPEAVTSLSSRLWVKFKSGSKPNGAVGFRATYQAICGGQFETAKGTIQSPSYPEWYPSNSNCIWEISIPQASIVGVRFYAFDVEGNENCSYDYLEVYDGEDETAPSLGRFCGKALPSELRGSSNKMTIKFMTDASINKPGFHLTFFSETNECTVNNGGCEQVCQDTLGAFHCACLPGFKLSANKKNCEETCGGIFAKPNGTIKTPGFPKEYPRNAHCVWEINAPVGQQISLEFKKFQLESKKGDECEYDYVEIKETNGKVLGKFCGASVPRSVTSASNVMRVEFRSDQSQSRKGFSAVFHADRDECLHKNGGCHHQCTNTVGSYKCSCREGYVLRKDKHSCKDVPTCGSSITGISGYVSSPNFPRTYPPNKNCTWKITVPDGSHVELTFLSMDIEWAANGCLHDSVAVLSGTSSQTQMLGQYCGTKLPSSPLISKAHKMTVTFQSDRRVNRRGFKARYKAVCGATLVAPGKKRVIYSHPAYHKENYSANMKCTWVITSRPGSTIQLRFISMKLEYQQQCKYDHVTIYDGNSTGSRVLDRVCGFSETWSRRRAFTSTGNVMLVKFVSDKNRQKKGFKAEYTRVKAGGRRRET